MKKVLPVVFTFLIIVAAGYLTYQAINNPIIISFASTPQPGVQRLEKIYGNSRLIWSPTENVIVGSDTNADRCPDWGCPQESEIFLIDLEANRKKTVLKLKQYGVYTKGWSPDGNRILFSVEGDGELTEGFWSLSVSERESPEKITDQLFVSWSYDGTKFAEVNSVDEIDGQYPVVDIVDLETNQKKQVFRTNTPMSNIENLSWSSDGEQIAFLYYEQVQTIYVLRLQTGEITQIANDGFTYADLVFSPQNNFIALKTDSQGYGDVVVIKDLSNNCQIELPGEKVKLLGSWSPNGAKFVFSTYDDYAYIIDLREFLGFDFQKANSLCL